MPVATNPLLQTPGAAASRAPAPGVAPSGNEPLKTGAAAFSRVYAQASDGKSVGALKAPVAQRVEGNDKVSETPSTVAESGKGLPAGKARDVSSADQDDSSGPPGPQVLALEPLGLAPAATPTEVVQAPPAVEAALPEDQAAQLAPLASTQLQVQPSVDDPFDPDTDPLDAMPAVRLAMEQGGHISASSQAPANAKQSAQENTPAAVQGPAGGIALLIEAEADGSTSGEGGEKAFKGLLDDGLKDLKSASSDTRVDDFASRLAALTQATVPKTVAALPVNQPLAMHQSGWTEDVVNRVMYLSSANLKSADIQLEPAELGRLDIRVNISADQAAQVNFVSAHAGVREALDSQMHRLREMFAQQGMGQVDVNVSDQSRNWQGQGQEQQAQSRASGQRLERTGEDEVSVAGVEVVAPSVVLGSSAVDYYA